MEAILGPGAEQVPEQVPGAFPRDTSLLQTPPQIGLFSRRLPGPARWFPVD
jgi:hypothetical protein